MTEATTLHPIISEMSAAVGVSAASPELLERMAAISTDDADSLFFGVIDMMSNWIRARGETTDFEATCRVAANEALDASAFVIRTFKQELGQNIDAARFALIAHAAARIIHDYEDFPDACSRTFFWRNRTRPERSIECAPKPTPLQRIMPPEREIGSGKEKLYVYFYVADRDLALRDGREIWPCKIGFTAQELSARIFQQRPSTGMYRAPVVGLVINTSNGRVLERAAHAALTEAGSRIDGDYGREWFSTSPIKIADWFAAYSSTVAALKAA